MHALELVCAVAAFVLWLIAAVPPARAYAGVLVPLGLAAAILPTVVQLAQH